MASTTDDSTGAALGPAWPTSDDPYKWRAIFAAVVFTLILPVLALVVVLIQPPASTPPWTLEAASLDVEPMEIRRGEMVFRNTCQVCHGAAGEGIHGLGKPLKNSAFVRGETDDELVRLVVKGRPVSDPANTTGSLMPARGAKGLSDEEIASVVVYLRAIQDPGAPPVSVEAWERPAGSEGSAVAAIELVDHPGHQLYIASCSACHGQGAQGLEDAGLPLSTSGFAMGLSDKDLIRFIKSGRPSWDANNSTGIDMPSKGGNPAITDDQLQVIVDYIRAVQREATGG